MTDETGRSPLLRVLAVGFDDYRGFRSLDLSLHPAMTVLYGENGAGKSNVLDGLATLLAGLWRKAPRNLSPDDAHEASPQKSFARQGSFPVRVRGRVVLRGQEFAATRGLASPDGHTDAAGVRDLREAFERLQQTADAPWPLVAHYGTERLHGRVRDVARRRPKGDRRIDAWVDGLDPRSNEEQLLPWWFEASLPRLQGAPAPAFDAMTRVLKAAAPADEGAVTRALDRVEMDVTEGLPVMVFSDGSTLRWDQLSDGYRVFLGLICDLARRAWVLNAGVLAEPIAMAEGVVLIDELDLHLHPRWQLAALPSLRAVFPRVQFVVTTHSPYVLASAENDQVRRLSRGAVVSSGAVVHGRDPNSVLAHVQGAPLRPAWAREKLDAVERAIDGGDAGAARSLLESLESQWTSEDPEIARLEAFLGWEYRRQRRSASS